jgi:hypothetical protein
MSFSRFALVSVVGIGLPGCFSSSASPPPGGDLDAGDTDATVDQTAPADTGASPEAAESDAHGDAPATSSPDASPDAGADATVGASDAGDAGPVAQDAASDAAPCPASDAGLPQTRCNGVCVDTSSDPANCGACNNVCPVPTSPSTGTCALGGCLVTLATGINFVDGLTIDSANVYFTNSALNGPNLVARIAKAGGTVTALQDAGGTQLGSVAIDSTHAYVTEEPSPFSADLVVAVPLDGGAPSTITSVAVTNDSPADLRVDGTNVYFTIFEYGNGRVASAPLGGGTATTLASGNHYPEFLTIDGAYVYFTGTSANGSVFQVPLADGGAPLALATGQNSPAGIAVDGTSVYWATGGSPCAPDAGGCGVVQKVPIGGGAAVTLASGVVNPQAMAIDSTYVYWTDWVTGNGGACSSCVGLVMRAPLGGGAATTLAAGQENPGFVHVDSSGIYWTNSGPSPGGSVMKLVVP